MRLAEIRNVMPRHLRTRCPTCGSEPGNPDTHRDGCPRIDTCGQYGPPWVMDPPWHPDDPMLDSRREGESLAEYRIRSGVWSDALNQHRREVHGLERASW